jgi:hypothetical protein
LKYATDSLTEKERNSIENGVEAGKTISLITYVLGDVGEAKLKYILEKVLIKYDKTELMELLYTSAKELIANSTKAAIKRMIFKEMGLDIMEEVDYQKGMEKFKSYLNEKKFPAYRSRMKENNFFIKISIAHSQDYIRLYVINNFSLIPVEENRVVEKFEHAKKYDNLFEFFMAHGDSTEGAGMGITMVEILLTQSGFDREYFQILSSKKAHVTIARVQVPMSDKGSSLVAPKPSIQQLLNDDLSLNEIKGTFF